ncbi:LOW QUALITY PROTEIN: hypothetical protein PHMEG_00021718 [Phytophthora megakarya]|uniref:Uncharacterized protein n=1 Tax=Phytophthora megakarya TaxID=4795 RepID=A0A225VMG3_9STRA|nr:LOW QUALITY PROTEIN: hypothetical protein PHMEG_00021718 [Phytophthora megakarya]
MLITLQYYAEERGNSLRRKSATYHGGCRTNCNYNEVKGLSFSMTEKQFKLVVGSNESYDIEVEGNKTSVTNPSTGPSQVIDMAVQISTLYAFGFLCVFCLSSYTLQFTDLDLQLCLRANVSLTMSARDVRASQGGLRDHYPTDVHLFAAIDRIKPDEQY